MRLAIANNSGKLLRFALVGGINTAIDIGLLFGLTALGVPKLAAKYSIDRHGLYLQFFLLISRTLFVPRVMCAGS